MYDKRLFKFVFDFDGKVLTFNEQCQKFFKLHSKEVIGIKRIYNFIQSDFLIDFIDKFDRAKKSKIFSFEYATSLNFTKINALFSIKKKFNFYIIEAFRINSVITPNKSFLKTIFIISRAKFTLGSIAPFIFALFYSINEFAPNSIIISCLLFVELFLLHVAANTFNDYFDWKSGRDKLNVDYVLFSTGGSRSIDFNLISEKKIFVYSLVCIACVILCSFYLIFIRGPIILVVGLIGIFCVYFYSAPPIHLASRCGLGELMHIICLGPLIVYGCKFSLTGVSDYFSFIIGLPFGLLITCCLLLNELPDSNFDKISGKNNLAVKLGFKYVPYLYSFMLVLSFLIIFLCIYTARLSFVYFSVIVLILYSYNILSLLFSLNNFKYLVAQSCVKSFNIYLYFSLTLYVSSVLDILIFYYPW